MLIHNLRTFGDQGPDAKYQAQGLFFIREVTAHNVNDVYELTEMPSLKTLIDT